MQVKYLLYYQCSSVPKAGRLCEWTIRSKPLSAGSPAYFEVCDLSKDPRFNQLPFVASDPHFRYYCGVPLRSRKGVAIGSIFALDDRVRPPIGSMHLSCRCFPQEERSCH